MRKKLRTWLILFVMVFLGLQARPELADAKSSTKVARLSICAYGDSLTEATSSSGSAGHAFLTIKNLTSKTLNFCDYPIKKSETISVSIWPDSEGWGGVFINREMAVWKEIEKNDNKKVSITKLSIDITKEQFNKIAKQTPQESYYHDGLGSDGNFNNDLLHNCTTYSARMWNLVAPTSKQIDDGILGIDVPAWVIKNMKKISGYQQCIFVPEDYDWTDVFYVVKDKTLVPCDLEAPYSLKCTGKTCSSVSLSWNFTAKTLCNKKKSFTGYRIYYVNTADFANDRTVYAIDIGSTKRKVTIKGLKSDATYGFYVCARYADGSYKIEGQYSKVIYATTKKETKLSLDKTSVTLYTGETLTLKATKTGSSKKINSMLTWKSSRPKVATVNKKGKVTARRKGTTYITAKGGGKTVKCKVTVKNSTLSLSNSSLTLDIGDSQKLTASYNGKSCSPKWKTSSKSIAVVKNGVVTGKKAGKATITATYRKKKVTCTVTVINKAEREAKSKALSAYSEFLQNSTIPWLQKTYGSGGTATWSDSGRTVAAANCSFNLIYLDNDAVPELLIYNHGQTLRSEGYGMLLTYSGGEVKRMACLIMESGSISYYKKKGIVIDYHTPNGSGEMLSIYEKITIGTTVTKLETSQPLGTSGSKTYYKIGDSTAKISKTQFNKELKKLVGSTAVTKKVELYKNTAANRKKLLGSD